MSQKSLYERLGGYDGITAFTNDLLPRLQGRSSIGSFLEESRRRWYGTRKATAH